MTRARLSELTLRRLWLRERLTEEFLNEVREWLLTAGWALVDAGSTYAAVKTDAVENWPRVAAKNIEAEILEVDSGKFNFEKLEHLIAERPSRTSEHEDGDNSAE
jgi:hypothetical protein